MTITGPAKPSAALLLFKPLIWILFLAAFSIGTFLLAYQQWMNSMLAGTEAQRRQNLIQIVSIARNAIEPILSKIRSGELNAAEGLEQVRNLVRTMTYEDQYGHNYVFMSSYNGIMLVQPFEPDKEMTNQWDLQDVHGVYIIRELVRAARAESSGSFIKYHYYLPGIHSIQEKLAYVVGLPALEAYVGTGMYMQLAIQEQKEILTKVKYGAIWLLLAVFIPISVSVFFISNRNRLLYAEISTREKAEEELKKSEEKYRLLVESANSIILKWKRNGEIIFLNDYGLRFFGFTEEEILGKNVVGTIVPQTESTKRDLNELMEDIFNRPDRYVHNTNENMCKDGRRVWVAWTNRAVMDDAGMAIEMFSVGTDITDRKRAEEERKALEERLQRAEKMEALGTLAGGVAHDLNNVLGILIGYSELLFEKIDAASPLRSHVQNIKLGGERAAAIVQDLLTLARRGVQVVEVANLNAIIKYYQKTLEYEKLLSLHPYVCIETSLEPELLNIKGSPVHLGKTLMNLLANAAEAMPQGGTIRVETRNQYLDKPVSGYDEVKAGDYAVLSVSDTGEGIKENDLKRVFEPFYTRKVMGRSGTGLGLAVVWGTVKDHQGYVNVESEEGKGSTFILYFPVTREALVPEQVLVSASEYMGDGQSILVVDDVVEQQHLACELLTTLNYRVTTVGSGEDAVEYLKHHAVDLVVLDMIMEPGMDGLDTYMKILEIHPRQKAIIVSGYAETDRVSMAQALGAGAYVKKPYVMEKLGLAVKQELNRSL